MNYLQKLFCFLCILLKVCCCACWLCVVGFALFGANLACIGFSPVLVFGYCRRGKIQIWGGFAGLVWFCGFSVSAGFGLCLLCRCPVRLWCYLVAVSLWVSAGLLVCRWRSAPAVCGSCCGCFLLPVSCSGDAVLRCVLSGSLVGSALALVLLLFWWFPCWLWWLCLGAVARLVVVWAWCSGVPCSAVLVFSAVCRSFGVPCWLCLLGASSGDG